MEYIIFSILLLFVLNCISPYKEINIEEIIKKEEEKKEFQKSRRLSTGRVIYKNPESIITIYNDYIIESISLSVKAEGGIVSNIYIPSSSASIYSIIILSCKLKMFDDK